MCCGPDVGDGAWKLVRHPPRQKQRYKKMQMRQSTNKLRRSFPAEVKVASKKKAMCARVLFGKAER
eukprot:6186185-Pleurochrysis_carterae.AAC.2